MNTIFLRYPSSGALLRPNCQPKKLNGSQSTNTSDLEDTLTPPAHSPSNTSISPYNHIPQRMNPREFAELLAFSLAPPSCLNCLFVALLVGNVYK